MPERLEGSGAADARTRRDPLHRPPATVSGVGTIRHNPLLHGVEQPSSVDAEAVELGPKPSCPTGRPDPRGPARQRPRSCWPRILPRSTRLRVGAVPFAVQTEEADFALLLSDDRTTDEDHILEPFRARSCRPRSGPVAPPRGRSPSNATFDCHGPFLNRRVDPCDPAGDDPVFAWSTDATCPIWDGPSPASRRSATRPSAPPGSPTRARLVPVLTRCPSSTGTCWRTPCMPARTRRAAT